MPAITGPYLSAKIALSRLQGVEDVLAKYTVLVVELKGNLTPEQASTFIPFYRGSILAHITKQVSISAAEGIIDSAASSVESCNKNSLLTPAIAGVPVNPAQGANAFEQIALLADALNAADQLETLINNANQILQ